METHTIEDLRVIAERGAEVGRLLESQGIQAALTMVRARLYEETMRGVSLAIREEARAEGRALERLMDALHAVQQDGVVAQETIRRLNDESD